MDASDFEAEMRQQYSAIRTLVPEGSAISVLHIGAENTGIAVGNEFLPRAMLALAIGSQRTARGHFKHSPPSPLELENAIVTVEDEVTRARTLIPRESTLYTADPAVREIALLSGVSEGPQMQLYLDALERSFDRLTSMALGRPASHEGLPAANTFAATLLILREFVHHMQFSSITVLE